MLLNRKTHQSGITNGTSGVGRLHAGAVRKPSILVGGRDRQAVAAIEGLLGGCAEYQVTSRVLMNGHADVLHDMTALPSLLVFRLTGAWRVELEAFAARPPAARPPLLVIGPEGDLDLLRMAMQAGARDFLTENVAAQDLTAAVRRVVTDAAQDERQHAPRLNVVINAKGGSGATLLACNLAHITATLANRKVALLDLDLQFGTLPLYLDLYPKHSLVDALEAIEELDSLALEGFMMKHASGLHVLGTVPDKVVLPHEVPEANLAALLDLLRESYDQIFIDLPRQLDHLTVSVLERADRIAVVIQQNLANLRDGTRLLGILRDELAIPDQRVTVVLNRFRKGADVDLPAVAQALRHDSLVVIPNDYRSVSESVNIGVPLWEHARGSAICKALRALHEQWEGTSRQKEAGLLSRALNKLLKRAD